MTTLALIDDDPLIRDTWAMVAKTRGHHLLISASYEEFVQLHVDSSTPIYVDYLLANNVKGIEVVKKLTASGYTKVYLSTGMPLDQAELSTNCKVVGKDYPTQI